MTPFFQSVLTIIKKDMRLEQRTGQTISVMVFFALAAVVTFSLALRGDLAASRNVSGGLIWVTILLAGTLGLNRSFAIERENSSMDGLLMAPVSRQAIYLGKVGSVLIFSLGLEVALAFMFFIFFNRPFLSPYVLGILTLGTIGFVAAGVLVTTMTIQTQARDVLLPVLLLPLTLPAVLAAGSVTATLTAPISWEWADISYAVALVVFYDIFMLLAGLFTFPFVVES
ncbi:MAG: heme exporter protein B [Cellvibrionaceae bacterium]